MIRLLEGDCREWLGLLEPETVDITLTSPPYNVGLDYGTISDNLKASEYEELSISWLSGTYRISKEGGRLYIVVSDNLIFKLRPLAEAIGWKWVQKLTWCKPNFVGTARRVSGDWNFMSEDILLFRKGKRNPMLRDGLGTTHNWFVVSVPQSNFKGGRIHPAQFPEGLCSRILSRTPGRVVFDPFFGSGTVGLVTAKLGRDFVGIELNPEYVGRAEKRLRDELRFFDEQEIIVERLHHRPQEPRG